MLRTIVSRSVNDISSRRIRSVCFFSADMATRSCELISASCASRESSVALMDARVARVESSSPRTGESAAPRFATSVSSRRCSPSRTRSSRDASASARSLSCSASFNASRSRLASAIDCSCSARSVRISPSLAAIFATVFEGVPIAFASKRWRSRVCSCCRNCSAYSAAASNSASFCSKTHDPSRSSASRSSHERFIFSVAPVAATSFSSNA
mmetsp:Transcript_1989/g.7670  ORF Transcript_1989/g.7670 Transcript_1989/m.7670 type:complete len:212 (-) Transcript_1989:669-1304(-)